jgi:hypothetical protein
MNVVVYYHFDVYLGISFCSYKRSVDLKLLVFLKPKSLKLFPVIDDRGFSHYITSPYF